MATHDAHYWLAQAKLRKDPQLDAAELDTEKSNSAKSFEGDLLPFLIATLANDSSVVALKAAANSLLAPFLALAVIAVALVAATSAVGWNALYYLAALFSLFSPGIFARSIAGFVDTDILNLFFLYSISLTIYLLAKAKLVRNQYVYAALAGALNLAFFFWYHQPMFSLLFLGALVSALLYRKTKLRQVMAVVSVFLVVSLPSTLGALQASSLNKMALSVFKLSSSNPAVADISNRLSIVAEMQQASFMQLPTHFFNLDIHPYWGTFLMLIGLLGLAFWLRAEPLKVFAFLPLLIFLGLSFTSAARFSLYSAPLIWIGLLHFVITVKGKFVWPRLRKSKIISPLVFSLMALSLLRWQLGCVQEGSACRLAMDTYVTPDSEWVAATQFLSEKNLDHRDVLLAWWDYGNFLRFATKGSVVHSNWESGNTRTPFFAEALLEKNVSQAAALFLGMANWRADRCLEPSTSCLLDLAKQVPTGRRFLLIDSDTFHNLKYINAVRPGAQADLNLNETSFYRDVTCSKLSQKLLDRPSYRCGDWTIDTKTGLINGKPGLAAYLRTDGKDNFVYQEHLSTAPLALVVSVHKGRESFKLISSKYFFSMTGRLWFGLGKSNLLKPIYNDPLKLRIYEVNSDF